MSDLISRQAAIEALVKAIREDPYYDSNEAINGLGVCDVRVILNDLPSAQPEYRLDEWCTDCKEYDTEKHCCPRFNQVIRTTLDEMKSERKKGEWLRYGEDGYPNNEDTVFWQCDQCLEQYTGRAKKIPNFCPNCGADMRGE